MKSSTFFKRSLYLVLVLLFASCKDLISTDSAVGTGSDAVTYAVNYVGNGNTSGNVPLDTNSYSAGNNVTVLANTGGLAKTGYVFGGWNTQYSGNGITYTPGQTFTMGTQDVILYAKWVSASGSTYTVTYNGNGNTSGTAPYDSSFYSPGQMVTVIGNTGSLAKTGFAFGGWNTQADGSGTTYAAGATFLMGGSNISLYAKWTSVSGSSFWARSTVGAANASRFSGSAVDLSGYVYAVGYVQNSGFYDFGSGVTINAPYAGANCFIVKYDSSGNALWAKTVQSAGVATYFNGVAIDSSGNIYAVGNQSTVGTVDYGSGATAASFYAGNNALIVKYDPSGNTIWALCPSTAPSYSEFSAVAVDPSDFIYAAGHQDGNSTFSYGGANATGNFAGAENAVIVRFDSLGNGSVAQTATTAPDFSFFYGIAIDSSSNIYVSGQQGSGTFIYGAGTTTGSSVSNALLVRYSSALIGQWGRTTSTGAAASKFSKVAVDASGNVYVAGSQQGTSTYTYGGYSATGLNAGNNVIVAKYNSSGTSLWASTVTAAAGESQFNDISADSSGNVYAAGYQDGSGVFTYEGGVNASGAYSGFNPVIVKYNTFGTAQWAGTTTAAEGPCYGNTVAADNSGYVYFAGMQYGLNFTYGTASVSAGYSGYNAFIVQYGQ